ncbi:hypothetical protein HNQ94_000866 [Salirhabdus euzebyi]|uniref:Lipoprotein n=1 Tax=Salirhabdus euzebyi TaxID=394506 RepID=A0A841PZ02_9BACI|nr:hypothetical protein [Salirhabdus euzebyi]MBB6452421.1 hypothetical protein [Salirhabdus euzebyi]
MKNKLLLVISIFVITFIFIGCRAEIERKIKEGNYELALRSTDIEETKEIRAMLDKENIDYLFEEKLKRGYLYIKKNEMDRFNHLLGLDREQLIMLVVGKRKIDQDHHLLVTNNQNKIKSFSNMSFDKALSFVEQNGGAFISVSSENYQLIEAGTRVKVTFNPFETNRELNPPLYKAILVEKIGE